MVSATTHSNIAGGQRIHTRNLNSATGKPLGSSKGIGWAWGLGIFLLALGIRLAYLAETADSPLLRGTYVDTQWHADWAREVAAGRVLQDRPFFRAPLYPVFLGGVYRLTGSFMTARVVQHAIGALSCVLTALLGARACGALAGRAAGLVCALYGPLMYFENELLIPSLAVFLFLGCLLAVSHAVEEPRVGCWLAGGFLLGLCALCRPNFLALLAVFLPMSLWPRPGALRPGARWWHAAGLLLATAVPIAPVTAHNVLRGGEWVWIASQGGINFWIGNNALADGRTATAPSADHRPHLDAYTDNVRAASRTVAEAQLGRALSDAEVSRYWFAEGLCYLRDQPVSAIAGLGRKFYYFFNGFEIESNRSMYLDRLWSKLFAVLVWDGLLVFPGGLLWPLALLGAALPRPAGRTLNMLRASAAMYVLTVVVFFVTARFRMPVVPLAAIFAARGVTVWLQARQQGTPAGSGWWLSGLALLAALSNSAFWNVRRIDVARQASIVATAHVQLGEFEDAASAYRQALELDPQRFTDRYNLALALQALGRHEAAIAEMNAVVQAAPAHAEAWNELGNLLVEVGHLDAAVQAYARAVELRPGFTMARANLGMALIDTGRFQEARQHLRQAAGERPDKATYHFALALACQALGDHAAAVRRLQQSVVLDPRFAPAHCELAGVLDQLGRFDEATHHRRRAAELGVVCPQ